MQSSKIGNLDVSVLGLGCSNFGGRLDRAEASSVVRAALDSGITFFDTADFYGDSYSERFLGEALGIHRTEVTVATKVGYVPEGDGKRADASRRRILEGVEDSLRRLGTDWIDLYQVHTHDPSVPIEETLGALHQLVEQGKVREIGCSNYSGDQIAEAAAVASAAAITEFASVQSCYNLLRRELESDGVLQTCVAMGLVVLAYSPLESGILTGKYQLGVPPPIGSRLAGLARTRVLPGISHVPVARLPERFLNDRNLEAAQRLEEFARQRGWTLTDLAISWLLAQSSVATVIAGAMSPAQVVANAAGTSWRLTSRDLAEVDLLISQIQASPL